MLLFVVHYYSNIFVCPFIGALSDIMTHPNSIAEVRHYSENITFIQAVIE